ncbi:MAG: ATP-binding protein [Sulfitobacter sp.]
MTHRALRRFIASLVSVFAICTVLIFVLPKTLTGHKENLTIDEVNLCHGTRVQCETSNWTKEKLPYFTNRSTSDEVIHKTIRFSATIPNAERTALMIPMIKDSLRIWVNDALVLQSTPVGAERGQHWNRPAYADWSAQLERNKQFDIIIEFSGYGQLSTGLSSIYIGAQTNIRPQFEWHMWFGPGIAWIAMFLAPLLAVGLLFAGYSTGNAKTYFGLSCALLITIIFGLLYTSARMPMPVIPWMYVWVHSVFLYVISLVFLIDSLSGSTSLNLRRIYLGIFLATSLLSFLVPETHAALWQSIVASIILFCAGGVILLIAVKFNDMTRFMAWTLLLAFIASLAMAVPDWVHHFTNVQLLWVNTGQGIALVIVLTSFAILFQDLVNANKKLAGLGASLQIRVNQKEAELKEVYETVSQQKANRALDVERQRITMELHDGLGGSLVSLLARLETATTLPQETIKQQLRESIIELGAVMDTLESDGDIEVVLAQIRHRVEPMLEDCGISLNWKILGTLTLPEPGPEATGHLARIVKEALTNALRHSGCQSVCLSMDANRLLISDDGIGMKDANSGGRGLHTMKARAEKIGLTLTINSNETGTVVQLSVAKVFGTNVRSSNIN